MSDVAARPSNVPADRVVDFDLYAAIPDGDDFHHHWQALQDRSSLPLVWTPHSGGHWIALTGALVDEVLADSDHFSSHTVLVPKDTAGEAYRLLPLSLDPPEHRPFRNLLNENLSPKALLGTEETIRAVAAELIEAVYLRGQCDFVREFAEKLPIRIFLQIVDLPLDDLPKLKYLADQFTRPEGSLTYPEVAQLFRDYIGPVIKARRNGGGADMLSRMINGQVNGRSLTDEEAANICIQVLVGGLDTVVNFMGFVMLHLAGDPALRRALHDGPSRVDDAVWEFLRRFPLVASAREVKQDYAFAGVELKAGDMVVAPTILSSLDAAINKDPFEVQLRRPDRRLATFGKGSHTCPGAHLARMEMRIVLKEWLARIPEFRLAPSSRVRYGGGIVGTVHPYVLEWDVRH
jgi:cytochrome P450